MPEQVFHRDVGDLRIPQLASPGLVIQDAPVVHIEVENELVHFDHAPLDQLAGGRRRDGLGHARHPHDRVLGQGDRQGLVPVAEGALVDDAPVVHEAQDGGVDVVARHVGLHEVVEGCEFRNPLTLNRQLTPGCRGR